MKSLRTDQIEDANVEGNQYLSFILDDEEYGVDILKVQEIRGWESATRIPNTPDFVLGVINLRGSVVPIVNLRKRFDLSEKEFNDLTVMILVNVVHNGISRTIGLVVDSVSEVYTIPEEDLSPPPDVSGAIGNNYIRGLATIEDKMIIVLDIDLLVNAGVLDHLETADE